MSKEQNFVIAGAGDMALDAWGVQKVTQPYSLFHSLFTFDVPYKKWRVEVNGTEEVIGVTTLVTSQDSFLDVKTDGVNGDVTYCHSRRHPQYQSNRGHVFSISAIVPTPTDLAVEDFGLFTDINGVFFRIHTDGELYACLQSDGVLTHEEKINMPFELDYSKGNVFDIQFQWRGAGNFRFFAGNPKTGRIELIHEIKNLNKSPSLSIRNPSLPAAFRVTSLGDPGRVQCGCVDITTEGGNERREQYVSGSVQGRVVSGTDVPVLIVRSPATAHSQMNTRDSRLVRLSGAADKRSVFKVWQTRDASAITGASFSAIGKGTFLEQDISATAVDTSKMDQILPFRVEANTTTYVDNPSPETVDFFIIHGDYVVITANVSSGTCDATIEFGEEV